MCVFYIVLVLRVKQPSSLHADERTLASKVSALFSYLSFRRSPEAEVENRSDSLFTSHKRMTLILSFLIPGGWFLITSFWSSYPEISASRALYFILISGGCISAGILWVRYSSKDVFAFLLPANILVLLLCLFSLVTNIPYDSWSIGRGYGFGGFFGHQNLLASVILFTLPSIFFKLLQLIKSGRLSVIKNTKPQISANHLLLTTYYFPLIAYCLLLTANLLLLVLTYSRSAIAALISGVIVFLLLSKNWKVLFYSFIIIVILALVIYSTPSLNQLTGKIINKDFPEIYSSRMWMWEPSYKAALEGGIFGLGYGMSHPDIKPGSAGDHYEGKRFVREKGNSILALVEETGLVGLILFVLPLILLIKRSWMDEWMNENQSKIHIQSHQGGQAFNHTIILSAIIAFIVHAQFEAWWVGVGSVQLPLFFLYLGVINHFLSINNKMDI